MVNNVKRDVLLAIIAEWLEERDIPPLVLRNEPDRGPENLKRILAIVGPRRAGKTYFMYQLIQSLLQGGRFSKGTYSS
jgi:predicted AAA+ superfamily ATPase